MLIDLRAGDIMFSRRLSPKAVEVGVRLGQVILGETGYPQHVGVVVEPARILTPWDGATYPGEEAGPRLVQAMPHGAEEVELGPEFWTADHVFLRPNYRSEYTAPAVARAARRYVGVPYSFADYLAIAGVHLGVRNGPIRRYVTTSKHMICSQLADQALSDAGWHVFADGRLPQDVTPAALYAKMMEDKPAAILGLGK